MTIDTGQPFVTVLSAEAAASPFGFDATAGTSSTDSWRTNAVRCVLLRTIGTAFETSVSPAFNGATGTALIGVAALPSSTGLAVCTWVSSPGPGTCLASNSNSARARPDLIELNT
ncbi:hypothetical protein [Pseudomonas sp. 31 R 17]|nr:hypothetical protein [Pseudomonas sp. 31 R 17]